MTEREVIEVSEMKIRLWSCASGRCEVCGRPIAVQDCHLAHRIPQSRMNLRKYGKDIIHHPMNLAVTCPQCNSAAIVRFLEEETLVEQIKDAIRRDDERHNYRENPRIREIPCAGEQQIPVREDGVHVPDTEGEAE